MKILFIDDSRLSRRITSRYLKLHFPEAEVNAIGPEDLEKTLEKSQEYQMVITDLLMPGISAEEVIKKILKKAPETFLVVLSANVQEKMKEKMQRLGVQVFLGKPLTEEKIITLKEAYYAGRKNSQ